MSLPRDTSDCEASRRVGYLVMVDESRSGTPRSATSIKWIRETWPWWVGGGLLGGAAALAIAFAVPAWYRAQALIAPVPMDTGGGGLSSLGGDLGGLAALAGLSLGDGQDLEKQAVARMTSREFTYRFLQEESVLPELFEGRWDAAKGDWRSGETRPSMDEAYRFFDERVRTVSEDRRNGLIKVTIDWKNPALAQQWANRLVELINADVRQSVRAEAEKNLRFLNREASRAEANEVRTAIYRLVEAEIKRLMIVNVREQYAFKVIDPAVVPGPRDIVKPRRAWVTVAGGMIGGVIGALSALLRDSRRRRAASLDATDAR